MKEVNQREFVFGFKEFGTSPLAINLRETAQALSCCEFPLPFKLSVGDAMHLAKHILRSKGKALVRLWESLRFTTPLIANRHWMMMKIEHDEVFYLGDKPVVLQNTENP